MPRLLILCVALALFVPRASVHAALQLTIPDRATLGQPFVIEVTTPGPAAVDALLSFVDSWFHVASWSISGVDCATPYPCRVPDGQTATVRYVVIPYRSGVQQLLIGNDWYRVAVREPIYHTWLPLVAGTPPDAVPPIYLPLVTVVMP